jgi:hypothetical protein
MVLAVVSHLHMSLISSRVTACLRGSSSGVISPSHHGPIQFPRDRILCEGFFPTFCLFEYRPVVLSSKSRFGYAGSNNDTVSPSAFLLPASRLLIDFVRASSSHPCRPDSSRVVSRLRYLPPRSLDDADRVEASVCHVAFDTFSDNVSKATMRIVSMIE